MSRPKALDLCCCEGGVSKGVSDRFDVYGVDLFEDYSQARYPFPSHKGDVLDVMARLEAGDALPFRHKDGHIEWLTLADFVLVLGSPPCQHASAGTRALRKAGAKTYPRLIEPIRDFMVRTGKPYVIENVKGADLRNPMRLCGCMFDLKATDTDGIVLYLERPRLFESNVLLTPPRPCTECGKREWVGGSYGGARRDKYEAKYVRKGGYVPSIPVQRELLGIDWMTQKGMHQAIPPAYASHIAGQVADYLALTAERAA